jgi:hypothetical protein
MGIETALIGGAAASGLTGAVKGAKGTPEKKQFNESQTTFDPATPEQQQLQQQSIQNYLRQQELAKQQEAGIEELNPLRQQALQASQDIVGGGAFNLSPDEQMRIMAQRQALIDQSATGINRNLQEQTQQLQAGAGIRNLRGQAAAELQGNALRASNQSLTDVTNQANSLAAQQALALPQARIQAQSPFIQQGLTLRDTLLQQAQQNRNALQNPVMLQLLQQQRLAGGTTRSTATTPKQGGGLLNGILGGVGGAFSGLGAGVNLAGGLQSLGYGGGIGGLSGGTNFSADTTAGQLRNSVSGPNNNVVDYFNNSGRMNS